MQVIAAVRKPEQADQFKAEGVETRQIDLNKPERYGMVMVWQQDDTSAVIQKFLKVVQEIAVA